MASSNNPDFVFCVEELLDGQGQVADGRGGRLLDKDVAWDGVLEGVDDQVYGVLQGHQEPGHVGIGDGQWFPSPYLFDEEGDDGSAGGHDVAVACAADDGLFGWDGAGFGDHDLFHHGFGYTHGIDGIDGLVGGEGDDFLDSVLDGGIQDVFCPDYVGSDGFHGEEFAGGDLF